MDLFACADVHLGNFRRFGGPSASGLNLRCRQALTVFKNAVWEAREARARALVVSGDLFDYSHVEPQLLAAVQDILRPPTPAPPATEIVLLVGNHDQDSTQPGDHALGPLRDFATVIEAPDVLELEDNRALVELGCVPFNPEPASEWLEGALARIFPGAPEARPGKTTRRILAMHLGVADDETPAWLRGARDSVHVDRLTELCQRFHIDAVFAGNWHNYALWQDEGFPLVVQTGALVPTGFDNPGLDELGGLLAYRVETGQPEMKFLQGPRFVQARSLAALQDQIEQGNRRGHQVYAQAVLGREDARAGVALVATLEEGQVLSGAEILVDPADAKAEARAAAHVAREQTTLDETIAAYVQAMPMTDGVSRERVLGRALGYLRAGRGAGL